MIQTLSIMRLGKPARGILPIGPSFRTSLHKHLFYSLVLGHAVEYFQATCTLSPFFHAPTSVDITSIFITLHIKLNGFFSFFLKDYKLD
jgi:hypothetical protein